MRKLGQTDLAIETILKKEEISPGLYETYANLGTFYIHAGRLKEGLEEIEKAIEINPDAHFGREVYQKLLVEYVLLKKADGKLELPMSSYPQVAPFVYNFVSYTMMSTNSEDGSSKEKLFNEEVETATTGILGMMRFGNFDSPVLLEAVADLLTVHTDEKQAKQLASRALLQASYVSADPEQKAAYRQLAEEALSLQARADNSMDEVTLEEVERQFLAELDEAEAWYADVAAKEKSWIVAGLNPEVEFSKHYAASPSQSVRQSLVTRTGRDRHENLDSLVFTLIGVVLAIGFAFVIFCFQVVKAIKAKRGQSAAALDDD